MHETEASAVTLARAFVAILRADTAMPDVTWCTVEEEAELLARLRQDRPALPRLAADVVAAAVALAHALAPLGDPGAAESFPVLLLRVPSPEWVEPVRRAAETCLLGPARDACGEASVRRPRAARHQAVVLARDGSGRDHRPDIGNDAVAKALLDGAPLLGIAADPDRTLPREFLLAVDRDATVAPPDAATLSLVVEAVTGEAPAATAFDGDLPAPAPIDLRVGVRPGLGAREAVLRLRRARIRRRGTDASGPCLEDMHGYGPARTWGLDLVADLRSWRSGAIPFASCESAALLSGPPGTGKTRFAMALARSAGLPLLAGSLAQWQGARDGHLGHTLGAMQQFFDEARRTPCVVLIDELDSFGDRENFAHDHRDYSCQVVNALLEHLDGARGREGAVVIGTTNHPSRIDPAILRSGRLERHFRIGLPDLGALSGILVQHLGAEARPLDLRPVTPLLRGMTGADVEALVRRARGRARRAGRPMAVDDLVAGATEGEPALGDGLRMRCAIHEAGHAVALLSGGAREPVSVSISPSGGLTETGNADMLGALTEPDLERALATTLAGRAAEEVLLGDVSAGSVTDLAEATRCALAMEASFGFSADYPLLCSAQGREPDLTRMPWLLRPVLERLRLAYERACDLMRTERAALERIAEALFGAGYLDDATVRALFEAPPPRRERRDRTARQPRQSA